MVRTTASSLDEALSLFSTRLCGPSLWPPTVPAAWRGPVRTALREEVKHVLLTACEPGEFIVSGLSLQIKASETIIRRPLRATG